MPKRDLILERPCLNSAGSLGFAPDVRSPINWRELAAFITNPISFRPRAAAAAAAAVSFVGGVLLHTGMPNPGFRRALETYSRAWAQAPIPVVLSLTADRPEETRSMVVGSESLENVLAVELAFAPMLSDDIILLSVESSAGEIPLIVSLSSDQLLRLGPKLMEIGVSAVSMASPRGLVRQGKSFVPGRLFGRFLLPQTLALVQIATRIGLPIIAAGGILTDADVRAALELGALAVELDTALWFPAENKRSLVG